jgi:hypothetical protein
MRPTQRCFNRLQDRTPHKSGILQNRAGAAEGDKMRPSDATRAAAKALRFQADELERRRALPSADHQAFNGAASQT